MAQASSDVETSKGFKGPDQGSLSDHATRSHTLLKGADLMTKGSETVKQNGAKSRARRGQSTTRSHEFYDLRPRVGICVPRDGAEGSTFRLDEVNPLRRKRERSDGAHGRGQLL